MHRIARYDQDLAFSSPRDALSDLVSHLSFCTSAKYSADLIRARHGVAGKDAVARGRRISAHMRTALDFVDQSISSRPEVAAVGCYYAILNLAKCYILASAHWSKLDSRLLHGLAYKTYVKDSHKLPTEELDLHPSGVIPTLYELIVGVSLSKQKVRMGDVYPYILDVGAEWELATGEAGRLASLTFEVRADPQSRRLPWVEVIGPTTHALTARVFPALVGFRKWKGSPNGFAGPPLTHGADEMKVLQSHVRRFLLYDSHTHRSVTPVSGRRLMLPQELPLALAFYHLSSIQRYNPEFMAKLKDSAFWSVVVSLQWHGLQKFALLAWSYLQQRNVLINA